MRQLFPVCITALSGVFSSTVAVCLYNCQEHTVQLYRQGKGVSIDDVGCAYASIRIQYIFFGNVCIHKK